MPKQTIKERVTNYLLGEERQRLQESTQLLYNAYLEGPFTLSPERLIGQLQEFDSAILSDIVQNLYWESLGAAGYGQDLPAERNRAIDESRRLWKHNPLAQWMVWLWTNYGFGESVMVTPHDPDGAEVWNEFWTAPRNQSILAADRAADVLSNWTLVDGDRFLAFFISTLDGESTIRKINAKEIVGIVTDPDDSSVPLFYKRQWTTPGGVSKTAYYPDWGAFFQDGDGSALGRAELPRDAVRADEQNSSTTVCILHIAFNCKEEESLFGWPLLAAGSPWIRSQKKFMEDRLAVASAKAMYVRRAKVLGGSRAVDTVIANLKSALSSTNYTETNPPAVAGSTLVENQAVDTTDFPMRTGAADARIDHEAFAWMALLSGGVFPHWAGMGDAYRLATATAMEAPLQRQFSRYQAFFAAQFRKMVQIVLKAKEEYDPDFTVRNDGEGGFETYDAEVNIDKLVEVDLPAMTEALGRVFNLIINPLAIAGIVPDEALQGMLRATLRVVLQALGIDAEPIIGDEVWTTDAPVDTEPETAGIGTSTAGAVADASAELEESVALALQNYRDGSVTADDLITLLLPTVLEAAEAADA